MKKQYKGGKIKRGRLKQNTKRKEHSTIGLMQMHNKHSNYKSTSTTSNLLIETLTDKSINLASKWQNHLMNWNKRKEILKRELL